MALFQRQKSPPPLPPPLPAEDFEPARAKLAQAGVVVAKVERFGDLIRIIAEHEGGRSCSAVALSLDEAVERVLGSLA